MGKGFSLACKTVILTEIFTRLANKNIEPFFIGQLIWLLFGLSITDGSICERHDGISLDGIFAYRHKYRHRKRDVNGFLRSPLDEKSPQS